MTCRPSRYAHRAHPYPIVLRRNGFSKERVCTAAGKIAPETAIAWVGAGSACAQQTLSKNGAVHNCHAFRPFPEIFENAVFIGLCIVTTLRQPIFMVTKLTSQHR
jgi:hypothetical protein